MSELNTSRAEPARWDNALHHWIPSLLQMSDTFYPTGSYAHSFGLEGLVQDGFVTDRATLRSFLLEQALPALARTDLVVAAAAWDAAGEPADFEKLEELCRLGSAMRGAREPREAADAIGRQRLELLSRRTYGAEDGSHVVAAESDRRVDGSVASSAEDKEGIFGAHGEGGPYRGSGSLVRALKRRLNAGTKRSERSATQTIDPVGQESDAKLGQRDAQRRSATGDPRCGGVQTPNSVVAAIEARAIGAPVEAALAALIYSAAAALLAAAVKLLRLGQNAVQALLTEALALAPALIAQALATPIAEAGAFSPWWDVAAARNERADFRLFIS